LAPPQTTVAQMGTRGLSIIFAAFLICFCRNSNGKHEEKMSESRVGNALKHIRQNNIYSF